jgi:hypothetical protein
LTACYWFLFIYLIKLILFIYNAWEFLLEGVGGGGGGGIFWGKKKII